jgi:hypothetical protein
MKLINLAKQLDFENEYEYFDYCIDSHILCQFNQCKELFKAMIKKDKKDFLTYGQKCYNMQEVYKFYFNLL